MKTLFALVVLIAVAAGAYWYMTNGRHTDELQQAQDQAVRRTEQMKDAVKDKLRDVSSNAPEIKEDIERTGRVVREKAKEVGSALKDATADARITAAIKAKLLAEPNLSAMKISVNTTDGIVTLSGSVHSAEEIDQAVRLAKQTDGVRDAISTLQVKPKK